MTTRIDPALDGHTNMARDAALLANAELGAAGARIYSWDGAWISLGRFQHPERDVLPGCTAPWTIRPTGGKAVLHGHDITVGMGIPLAAMGLSARDLKPAYRWAIAPIVAGLRACGVDAVLAERTAWGTDGRPTADCFAFNSPNDVVSAATGQKLCGVALRLTDKALLVQASLPVGPPLVDPVSAIRGASKFQTTEWNPDRFAEGFTDALDRQLVYSTIPT